LAASHFPLSAPHQFSQKGELKMSDPINNFQGPQGWDHHSSQEAGKWQAQQHQTPSPQQANESWLAFQTRQATYEANKQK
jgi:hypothetical protein